ncbi:MAG: hypothetical protein JNG90_09960 [Planctomycetaceae bacterium]|nr:hypothetical protein [Planctomycetaceae bacterium]
MATTTPQAATDPLDADPPLTLRDPALAAFLAWLVPGLGHLYQGRTAKGVLFMVCILGTFIYGLFLGGGRVVYAQWRPEKRLPYLCQIGVGIPALPALVQASRARSGKPLLFGSEFMAPPRIEPGRNELADLHLKFHRYFELGTVYTMVAGLLNMLVIYDAFAGPAYYGRDEEDEDEARAGDTGPPAGS